MDISPERGKRIASCPPKTSYLDLKPRKRPFPMRRILRAAFGILAIGGLMTVAAPSAQAGHNGGYNGGHHGGNGWSHGNSGHHGGFGGWNGGFIGGWNHGFPPIFNGRHNGFPN